MTLTIYEGYDKSKVIVKSKDEEFTKLYGSKIVISTNNIYKELAEIAETINNVLGEECLFEID